MATTDAQPKSIIEKKWAPIDGGMKQIGRLVTASAILKIISRSFEMPLFAICKALVASYTKIFHPIVEHTFGVIPRMLGYEFLPMTKDIIVLYSIGAAVAARSFMGVVSARRIEMGIPKSAEGKVWSTIAGIIWPLMLLVIALRWRATRSGKSNIHFRRSEIPRYKRIIDKTLSNVRKEIIISVATIAAFLLLNAAKV